jgi:23S rRNA (pseudouridine1915-N3)-methyltransferase
MKISLFVFGKTKERFFQEAEAFYTSRVAPFADLQIVHLSESKITKSVSEETVLKEEEQKLFSVLPADAFFVALDPKGKQFLSEAFAQFLAKERDFGRGKIAFAIGGALGFSENVRKRSDMQLSLSAMTFPHDLVRTMFLEQLYRGFMILANREYHR